MSVESLGCRVQGSGAGVYVPRREPGRDGRRGAVAEVDEREDARVDLGRILPVPRHGPSDLRRGVKRGSGWGGAIYGPLFSNRFEARGVAHLDPVSR